MSNPAGSDIAATDLDQVRSLLSDVRLGAQSVREATKGWKDRLQSTAELSYPSGISLLSLKNHLLLSYLHHLVALFALKLSSTSLTSTEGTQVVGALVKLRVVLEKVAPLEQKLKYQVEKLVRKADQAAEGADEQDVLNGESYVSLVAYYQPRKANSIVFPSLQILSLSDRILRISFSIAPLQKTKTMATWKVEMETVQVSTVPLGWQRCLTSMLLSKVRIISPSFGSSRIELTSTRALHRQEVKETRNTFSPRSRYVCRSLLFDPLRRDYDRSLSFSRSFFTIWNGSPSQTCRRLRNGSLHSYANVEEGRETSSRRRRGGRFRRFGSWKGRQEEVGWIRCRV